MNIALDELMQNCADWKAMALGLRQQAEEWEPERAQLVAQVQAAESERDQARAERDEARAMLETASARRTALTEAGAGAPAHPHDHTEALAALATNGYGFGSGA